MVEICQAKKDLSEARNTVAQFILSISKNEYDLNHSNTVQSIYNLISLSFD